jgi:mutator protein MutT
MLGAILRLIPPKCISLDVLKIKRHNSHMEIHKIQREILKELSFADKLIFSDFKIRNAVESDLFNYHLQALVETGYLAKDDSKKYSLTEKGKSAIQFMDVTNQMSDMKMPKVAIQIFIYKEGKVLLSKRLKHPFKDYLGFASGKVSWGEDSEMTMKRETSEEIGVIPTKYHLYAIRRCIDFNDIGDKVIHDAVYYVYLITDFSGEIVDTQESENRWFKLEELKNYEILPVTKSILEGFKGREVADVFYEAMKTQSLSL